MSNKLWSILGELQSDEYEWVDLSHSLNNSSPYWGGIPEGAVELGTTVFDWGNPMLECLIQTFKVPGQFGTHIDFPGHFIPTLPRKLQKKSQKSEEYQRFSLLFLYSYVIII